MHRGSYMTYLYLRHPPHHYPHHSHTTFPTTINWHIHSISTNFTHNPQPTSDHWPTTYRTQTLIQNQNQNQNQDIHEPYIPQHVPAHLLNLPITPFQSPTYSQTFENVQPTSTPLIQTLKPLPSTSENIIQSQSPPTQTTQPQTNIPDPFSDSPPYTPPHGAYVFWINMDLIVENYDLKRRNV